MFSKKGCWARMIMGIIRHIVTITMIVSSMLFCKFCRSVVLEFRRCVWSGKMMIRQQTMRWCVLMRFHRNILITTAYRSQEYICVYIYILCIYIYLYIYIYIYIYTHIYIYDYEWSTIALIIWLWVKPFKMCKTQVISTDCLVSVISTDSHKLTGQVSITMGLPQKI